MLEVMEQQTFSGLKPVLKLMKPEFLLVNKGLGRHYKFKKGRGNEKTHHCTSFD